MAPDLNGIKMVVNDMVNRKAKFGSYEASKRYFDETYENRKNTYYDENGKVVGFAYEGKKFKSLHDETGEVDVVYISNDKDDKFEGIHFRIGDYVCKITDNGDGKVDGKDKIEIFKHLSINELKQMKAKGEKPQPVVLQQISVFLRQ